MKKLFGNTAGLKASQIKQLEKLYDRRTRPEFVVSPEIARDICALSHEIRRQTGLLINRAGKINAVIIGDFRKIVIPDLSDYRAAPGRLKGLRCVHTHLGDESLTHDDLTDLSLLRLDMMAAITMTDDGLPRKAYISHIMPSAQASQPYQILSPLDPSHLDIDCLELIRAIETELAHTTPLAEAGTGQEKAILVSVTTAPKKMAMDSLDELKELSRSSSIFVIETILQHRKEVDPRYLMGQGKLNELALIALQKGATLIIFDQELNASQIRSITDRIDLKVIDRTQLILDIFAQRARTKEGKLQVELAQLNYLLPRLIEKNTAMSRLTGGIGGRGPGETKLEINRRRIRDRITRLEKNLELVRKQRNLQRSKRDRQGIPIISIIGYTNAGKSTLLNTLTKSTVLAESRMFATLDPSSRRLRFPKDIEVIITDTVGFIKNLPEELLVAFRATLEELENADILLHVIDISAPRCNEQIQSVEKILSHLNLQDIPVIQVLNKIDLADKDIIEMYKTKLHGIPVSANKKDTLPPLTEQILSLLQKRKPLHA